MSTSEITKMEEGDLKAQTKRESGFCGSPEVVQIIQKVHINNSTNVPYNYINTI